MSYNQNYLDIKSAMMEIFLSDVPKHVADISYSVNNGNQIDVQVVLLDGGTMSDTVLQKVNSIKKYMIKINVVSLSKEKYNETKGIWIPKYYNWKENLLFSKAVYKQRC